MSRFPRVATPAFFALVFGLVLWIEERNPAILASRGLDSVLIVKVLWFLFWLAVIVFAVRIVNLLVFDVVAARRSSVPAPTLLREIVSIVLYVALILVLTSRIFGGSVTGVLATGTVLAAVLGLALQETLGNLFAGIALHLEDSFAAGDVIRSGDYIGVVEAVRWRGTRIRTFNNNQVIVPNSMLARERIEIFPRNNLNARVMHIGIDQNVPPATVIAVLTQVAANVEGVAQDPPALARIGEFSDSWITYDIKYHTQNYAQRDRIDAEIRKGAWYALRRNDIPLAFPTRSMLRYQSPAGLHEPGTQGILENLAAVDILSPLSQEEQAVIASAARVHFYAKGETIIRRGATGDSMFVVHEGSVAVRAEGREVANLGSGEFFGEMALLTGEARVADVIATTDVTVVEIGRDALQPVLQSHPDLAAAISARVVERRGRLETLRESHEEAHRTMLSRVRQYFGL